MTIRIDHLEVLFEVDPGNDEAVFAQLFERHAAARESRQQLMRRTRRLAERNRQLGDRPWEED